MIVLNVIVTALDVLIYIVAPAFIVMDLQVIFDAIEILLEPVVAIITSSLAPGIVPPTQAVPDVQVPLLVLLVIVAALLWSMKINNIKPINRILELMWLGFVNVLFISR
jgi:hypothetical protein